MDSIVRFLINAFVQLICSPQTYRNEGFSNEKQTLFFANHSSHLDTLVIMSALNQIPVSPPVRPVAALDYWGKSRLRRYIAEKVLHAVFVDRLKQNESDPLDSLRVALRAGNSLIIFPEGTRSSTGELGKLKSGLYRLACEFPNVIERCAPIFIW